MNEKSVDLLYLAFNRFEFTRESFTCLVNNTDWQYVNQLHVYDDGSTDGTAEWLEDAIRAVPVPVDFRHTRVGSPVTLFVDFIQGSSAPMLAKCDSDAVYPPAWLSTSLGVMDRYPDLDLLGIEAMYPLPDTPDAQYGYTDSIFMSGLGLYKRSAFERTQPRAFDKYFGLEEWQMEQGAALKRGWITPALPVFLLDRMPTEPWRSLSAQYIANGWQRPWPGYDDSSAPLWRWRWPDGPTEARPPDPAAPAAGVTVVEPEAPEIAPVEPAETVVPTPPAQLNLACLEAPLDGFLNAGLFHEQGVEAVDLEGSWPWADATFDHVRCWDVLPRLPDKVQAMNELWRITKRSGTVELSIPSTDGPGAFQDPTYRTFWNLRSLAYFEDGNSYRERFSGMYGIRAAWRVLEQRTDVTDDGPHLVFRLEAVTAEDAAIETTIGADTGTAKPRTPVAIERHPVPGLVGAMRIKNESAHIREVLESALTVCDRVLVLDDNSDDDTVAICHSFGAQVSVLPSPFTGLDEARDKNYLLTRVLAEHPDWVLWIDGDEVLERSGPARVSDAIAHGSRVAAYALRIAFLWDSPYQVRTDGVWGRLARPSLFRVRGQQHRSLTFAATGFGGNFHCGNVPRGLVGETRQLDVRLKHYGYQTPQQRRAKYEFYTTRDPNNVAEDNYRHLAEIPGARHAPGPPRIEPWLE